MPDAIFAHPDLTTFRRLDELGLVAAGQRIEPDRAVPACRVADPDLWCRRCGCQGTPRDTVVRRLAREPLGWRPTWDIYLRMIAAYREADRIRGRELMATCHRVRLARRPGRAARAEHTRAQLKKRAADVLAYFDRTGTSNGPTAAINGRLEHLRGSAPGFRSLTNYIARSLLETGGFRPDLHPRMR